MSKVIASRIESVLPNIIHHNQTGYVKDRFIGETIRSIYDIMDYTVEENITIKLTVTCDNTLFVASLTQLVSSRPRDSSETFLLCKHVKRAIRPNIPGLLISIDFEKVFDSVEWDFLFKCPEAFNFGSDFLHWIKTSYKNVQSCTINNGTASSYFPLERGVRQGDPLSPYLFIVVVETLAIAIRQNQRIRGISIENEEPKILQYADDITAVLSDVSSAEQLLELFYFFKGYFRS